MEQIGIAIVASLVTAIVFWLSNRAWQWIHRPNPKTEVGNSDGFISETTLTPYLDGSPPERMLQEACYTRVKIINVGRRFFQPEIAKGCKGYLAMLMRWDPQKADFVPTSPSYHDTLKLCWSHNPGTSSMDLLPDTPHWLDVFRTLDGSNAFFLCTQWEANRYREGFDPGVYRFTIQLSCEGMKPIPTNLYLIWEPYQVFEVMDDAAWQVRKKALISPMASANTPIPFASDSATQT